MSAEMQPAHQIMVSLVTDDGTEVYFTAHAGPSIAIEIEKRDGKWRTRRRPTWDWPWGDWTKPVESRRTSSEEDK